MGGGARLGAGRRPALDAKTEVLHVRLTPQEMADLKATADHYNLTVANLVRRALGLIALLLVVGCCPLDPYDDTTDAPPGADEARRLIELRYTQYFGQARGTTIYWTDYPLSGGENLGEAYGCSQLWIYRNSDLPSETSLAHEIAHCYAGDVDYCGLFAGHGDSHTDPVIWGESGLVSETNAELAAMGL